MNKPVFRADSAQAIVAQLMDTALAMGVDTPIQMGRYGRVSRPITPTQYLADQEALKKRAAAEKATVNKNNLKQARKAALRLKYRKENQ